ncbi:hypothetical protein AAG906_022424 [Vitis piasezkii]
MEVVGELLLSAAFQVLFDKLASSDFLTFARQEHMHSQLKRTWPMTWRTSSTSSTPKCCDASWQCNLRPPPPPPPPARYGVSSLVAVLVSLPVMLLLIYFHSQSPTGFGKVAGTTTTTWKRTPTTSLFNEPQVHGRDDDKNKIVDLLLSDESAVVPIVGMGGLGKTTWARFAYNDDAVVKHFSPRAWVCVSDEFDVVKITKAILGAISQLSNDSNDFNQLQVELSQSLAGKRFLLVLDDVVRAKGSKVIVTTHNTQVALMMEPSINYHHSLKPLSYDDCWSIFVQHAFENRDIQEHPNLKSIGKKIVEKCDGLPLAAKVLGGLLRSKHRDDEWEHILNRKIWSLPDTECGIIPALRLSYHHLPAQLKDALFIAQHFLKTTI